VCVCVCVCTDLIDRQSHLLKIFFKLAFSLFYVFVSSKFNENTEKKRRHETRRDGLKLNPVNIVR
jgi:hypothetical protein